MPSLGEIRNEFWKEFQKSFEENYKNIIEENYKNIIEENYKNIIEEYYKNIIENKDKFGKFIFNLTDADPHVMQVYSYNKAGLNIHLSTNSVRRYMEVHLIYFHNGNHNGNHKGTNGNEHFVINKIYNNICENKIKTLLNNENVRVNLEKRENPHSYDTLYYKYNEYSIRDKNKWIEYFPVLSKTIVHFLINSPIILNDIM